MQIEHLIAGRLSGKPLAFAARALRQPALAALAADVMRRELGISQLGKLMVEGDTLEPDVLPRPGRAPRAASSSARAPEPPPWVTSSDVLTRLFRERRLSPEELLDRMLSEADRLAERQPWLRCVWLRDEQGARAAARRSGDRYARGQPLGPLDGVPMLVKEQLAVAGLPRRVGQDAVSGAMEHDATVVARLRAAGAIIVGQTAMTELGLSPIGVNAKRPPLRNPHHIERAAGGSSTGSAVAVSVGLVPCAVGADGGGSIRIPAAFCGVFGLKPSCGRVSRAGDAFSGSLDHIGPIAASTRELALFLDAVAGPDPDDRLSLQAPEPRATFASALGRGVRGLRVGIDEREWRDADAEVQRSCEQALAALVRSGVELVSLSIPLAAHAPAIGFTTIAAEAHALFAGKLVQRPETFGQDTQVLLAMAAQLDAREYLWAQALRERLRRETALAFLGVDVLATPTTTRTALGVTDVEDRTGRVDAAGVRALCRYTFFGNLTGLPCASAPVGLDAEGLPIGLQLIGDAWDEGTLLALLAELERLGQAHVRRPPYHVGLLET